VVEINRDFAGHFRPSFVRRLCVRVLNYFLDHPHPWATRPAQQVEQSAT